MTKSNKRIKHIKKCIRTAIEEIECDLPNSAKIDLEYALKL